MQGSRTCTSAAPPTSIYYLTTTNSINCDEATFQASRIVTLSQTNYMYRHECHVTLIQCCGSKRRRQTSSSMKNVLIRPQHMQSLQNVFVFLVSYSNAYIRVQALLGTPACNALTTFSVMKIDWFTTLVRHFANVANASDQPTYIGPMLVCCLGCVKAG